MTQKYTKVVWQDETTSQQGTLINAARLDQMQTAHHFADGFEEVDAVPTADPGVDYHKVVYCTADTTFYRWNGSAWVKDIDDDTKQLLLDHEADHNNPHVVTKAQVGLGNCDNTSDMNKPVSTATQTALDAKVDIIPVTSGVKFYSQSSGGTSLYQGTSSPVTGITSVPLRDSSGRIKTAAPSADDDAANKKYVDDADALKLDDSQLVSSWQGTPDDDHIPSEKLVKTYIDTSLTDGSVTKVGTSNVGSDLKPIKLVAGVPTAVANDLVDVASAQNITATKKATYNAFTSASGNTPTGIIDKIGNVTVNSTTSNRYFYLKGALDNADKLLAGISVRYNANGDVHYSVGTTDSNGSATQYEIAKFVRSTDTWTSKMVSDSLDAYTPMVRTTGNQTMTGEKTFTRTIYIINTIEEYDSAPASNTQTLIDLKDKNAVSIGRMEHWAYTGGSSSMNIINNVKRNGIQPSPTIRLNVTDQGVGAVMAVNQRAYNTANNDDVVTISTLKAATDVVHTSGVEDIAGDKRFLANMAMKKNSLETLVAPANNQYWGLVFTDKNNKEFGGLRCAYPTTRNNYLYLSLMDLDTDTQVQTFSFYKTHMTGPDRGYNAANIHDVATITTLDAYTPMVRTTGNQIVAGEKSISNINNNRITLQTSNSGGGWRKIYEWTGNISFTVIIHGRTGSRRNGAPIIATVAIGDTGAIGDGTSWNYLNKMPIGGTTSKQVGVAYDPNSGKTGFYYYFPNSEFSVVEVIGTVSSPFTTDIAITPVLEDPTTFTNNMVV